MTVINSHIISRHSRGGNARWKLEAENLAPWCRLPASPHFPGFYLIPNSPNAPMAFVRFGPFDVGPDIDAFSYRVSSTGRQAHRNTINVNLGILDAGGTYFSHSQLCLSWAEVKPLTLSFDTRKSRTIYLTFSISFRDFVDMTTYDGIEFSYIVGHKWNLLTDLFNRMGSDKGTEWAAGNGVPHCYSVEYYSLFESWQEEEFNFLEIGLDNDSKDNGHPQDAPSLRAWRQFFKKAKLYGYDINDFSFFTQEGTRTFQGNQASREDVRHFLHEAGEPQFRIILDDGSHASSHQQISLSVLFASIEPGGMYLIEDLGWQPFVEVPSTLDVLHRFIETAKFDSPFITDIEARYLEDTVSRVDIYKPNDSEFAVIYKKE